jgi:hypothetical protein
MAEDDCLEGAGVGFAVGEDITFFLPDEECLAPPYEEKSS